MCGIWLQILWSLTSGIDLDDTIKLKTRIGHRGPDETRMWSSRQITAVFHRLSIQDLTPAGSQPFIDGNIVMMCNGEIYNAPDLIQKYSLTLTGTSDCEVILRMYQLFGGGDSALVRITEILEAEFALVIIDYTLDQIYIARDFGIRPLFWIISDNVWVSSEAKGISEFGEVTPFPPRCWARVPISSGSKDSIVVTQYYPLISSNRLDRSSILSDLVTTLTESVRRRLASDRPLGFFLSGGLDSSLVVAIAARLLPNTSITTFSVGFDLTSPDLQAARKVAAYFSTIHHEVIIDFESAWRAIPETIYALESFDTTTIRASVPQYLLSKYVKNSTSIRVLLSGEGSDELAYGYQMWKAAPSEDAATLESVRLSENLYLYDCLRTDRVTAAHGLEVRTPFLARPMVELLLSIDSSLKLGDRNPWIEKRLLRDAFSGYLPSEILWRRKEAFSDAVGFSWVDSLRSRIEALNQESPFPTLEVIPRPRTSEEVYYRCLYETFYPGQHLIPDYWKQAWTGQVDPSARFLTHYTTEIIN